MQSTVHSSAENGLPVDIHSGEVIVLGGLGVPIGPHCQDVEEVGEDIVGPADGELVREIGLLFERVDFILAMVGEFIPVLGVEVLAIHDEVVLFIDFLPMHP